MNQFEMKCTKNGNGNSCIELKMLKGAKYTFIFNSSYAFDFARERLEEVQKKKADFADVLQHIKMISAFFSMR